MKKTPTLLFQTNQYTAQHLENKLLLVLEKHEPLITWLTKLGNEFSVNMIKMCTWSMLLRSGVAPDHSEFQLFEHETQTHVITATYSSILLS